MAISGVVIVSQVAVLAGIPKTMETVFVVAAWVALVVSGAVLGELAAQRFEIM